MDARLASLAMILELNTDLLLNGLEGLSDSEAQHRLPGGGNSVAFLAAHLTDSRHFLASRLGHPLPNPLALYLADAKSIDEIRSWATLDQVRAAWLSISAGQVAFVRRQLGKPAMTYTRGTQNAAPAAAV